MSVRGKKRVQGVTRGEGGRLWVALQPVQDGCAVAVEGGDGRAAGGFGQGGHLDRVACGGEGGACSVRLNGEEHVAGDKLGVVEGFGHGLDAAGGYACGVEGGDPVVGRLFEGDGFDQAFQQVDVFAAGGVVAAERTTVF